LKKIVFLFLTALIFMQNVSICWGTNSLLCNDEDSASSTRQQNQKFVPITLLPTDTWNIILEYTNYDDRWPNLMCLVNKEIRPKFKPISRTLYLTK